MRKVLKWIGIGLGVLIGLLITSALILYFMGGAQLNKTRQVQPAELTIPTDDEASSAASTWSMPPASHVMAVT